MLRRTQLLASNQTKLLYSFRDFSGSEEVEVIVWEVGKRAEGEQERGCTSYITL